MAERRQGQYAATTTTPISTSRGEIEHVLERFGATTFGYLTDSGRSQIGFVIGGRRIRIELPMPDPSERRFTHSAHKNTWSQYELGKDEQRRRYEQACRARWRALVLILKAKLAAIEEGITTVEHEFLPHMVLPDGRTIAEATLPALEAAYANGGLPALLSGANHG